MLKSYLIFNIEELNFYNIYCVKCTIAYKTSAGNLYCYKTPTVSDNKFLPSVTKPC